MTSKTRLTPIFEHRPARWKLAAVALALGAGVATQLIDTGVTSAASGARPKLAAFVSAVGALGGGFADLDGAAAQAKLAPRLMLPELSSTFQGPSGGVVYLPSHVTPRSGGRVSLLELSPGQTTVAGVYVVNGQIYERHVTRQSGSGKLARHDLLKERIVTVSGELAQTLTYQVTSVDHGAGSATFSNVAMSGHVDGDIVNGNDGWCWSCNGGSSWWCGFPCFPDPIDGDDDDDDTPSTAAVCGA